MATTTLYANFSTNTSTLPDPWDYNKFNTGFDSVGELSSDLLDDAGASTSITLDVTAVFPSISGSSGTATAGAGTWPEDIFDYYWRVGGTNAVLQLGGLTDGQTFDLEIAGHTFESPGRDTDVIAGGDSDTYIQSAGTVPTAPITLTGTVSGTTLDIDMALVSASGYLNGFKIILTDPPEGTDFIEPPPQKNIRHAGRYF